jgi:hypothetical protein
MKYILILGLALLSAPVFAADASSAKGDPSVAQIEAVMGPQTAVERTGPGEYKIDDESVTLAQLLGTILPQKENALKAMQDNIKQRQATAAAVASGVSIETKRAQCQKLPASGIDRTRCYQELEDLRDRQNQSADEVADRQKDDELQADRLQQEIEAIEQFKKQFAATPAK